MKSGESSRAWLEGLQKRFEERLSSKLEEIAKQEAEFFIDDVKNLMKELLNELDKITNPKDAFNAAEQMDRRRSEVTDGVKTKLRELTQNADAMLKAVSGSTENLPTTVAGGSAVAVIGTIIALGLKAAIFDITGGILTAIGFAIAGFAIIWKRGRIVEQFETGLDQGKQQLEDELKAKLAVSLRGVYHEIEIVFQAFFDYLKFREDELRPQITALEEAQAGLLEIAKQVKVVAEGPGPANKSKSVLLSRSPDKDQ